MDAESWHDLAKSITPVLVVLTLLLPILMPMDVGLRIMAKAMKKGWLMPLYGIYKFRLNQHKARRELTSALAVRRFFGVPVKEKRSRLRENYEAAALTAASADRLGAFSSVVIGLGAISTELYSAVLLLPHGNRVCLVLGAVVIPFFSLIILPPLVKRRVLAALATESESQAFGWATYSLSGARNSVVGKLLVSELDDRVNELILSLGAVAESGYPVSSESRRKALAGHVASVQVALDDSVSRVLVDGNSAMAALVAQLSTIQDRMIEGRWLGLLEPSSLPVGTELVTRRRGNPRRDIWVAIGAALLGTAAVLAAEKLGFGYVAPAVAIVITTVITNVFGRGSLGRNPGRLLADVTQSLRSGSESQRNGN